MKRQLCQHCEIRQANRGRKLCLACFKIPGVWESLEGENEHPEPTEAELDAMIAEQLPTMPRTNELGRRTKVKHWTVPLVKVRGISRRNKETTG